MNLKIFSLIAFFCPMTAQAWEVFQETEDDGRVFTVAEQAGEAGAFLRLVCFEKKIHLEVIYPAALEPVDDTVELFQIDNRPERLVAGFIDQVDASTSVFVGVDRRDEPAAATKLLVDEMAAFYHDSTDITDQHQRKVASIRLIAKMPTIAAMAYKYTVGQPFVYPRNDVDYASNFLRMCFAVPAEDYEVNPILSRAMDRIFTLHADHEQNASTSTVRLASSSGANPFACIAAGIACLWGPAHGGANQACLEMLNEIGTVDRIPEFIARAKDKDDPFRLMGFGHRVYKNIDPRATVLKESADEVLELLGVENNPILQVAKELEKAALADPYFAEKKLFPNVDFYSGIILEAMGFPTSMFTPIFALSRTVGWISQWKEMISDPTMKIGRPRQLYCGDTTRNYVDIENR